MTIEVRRTGTLSDTSTGDKIADAHVAAEYGKAWLKFHTERGTGYSVYSLLLHPESYADIIRAMLHANPQEAVKAIGVALQDGVPERKLQDGEYWRPEQAA